MSEWHIDLPYTKPPMSLNDKREHWAVFRRKVGLVRKTAEILARQAGIPRMHSRVTVRLIYRPKANLRRDPVNLSPVVKAAVDGLVDAGVLDDDDRTRCEQTPVIVDKGAEWSAGSRLRLHITELVDEEDCA